MVARPDSPPGLRHRVQEQAAQDLHHTRAYRGYLAETSTNVSAELGEYALVERRSERAGGPGLPTRTCAAAG